MSDLVIFKKELRHVLDQTSLVAFLYYMIEGFQAFVVFKLVFKILSV